MYYEILDFDSSNIKVLNDIETISGVIKIDGKDVIQDSSNYIKNIKERIITQDSDLNDVIISDILPRASETSFGAVKIDNQTITMDANGIISGTQNVNLSDYATKQYVDSTASGLDIKDSVKVATIANITLSGLLSIDGVTTISGDRILVLNQTDQTENGVYIASTSAWTRAYDFDKTINNNGAFIFVENGPTNGGSGFVCNVPSDYVDGDSITFTKFSSTGEFYAGDGILKDGSTISLKTKTNGGIDVDGGGAYVNLSKANIAGVLPITKGGTGAQSLNGLITLNTHTTGKYVEKITGGAGIVVAGEAATGKSTIDINIDKITNGGLYTDSNNKLGVNLSDTAITGVLSQSKGGTGTTSLNSDIIIQGNTNKFIVNNNHNSSLTIAGDLLPSQNEVFNIGSPDNKWKALYVAADTIHIGNTTLSAATEGGVEMSSISFSDKINKITSNELHSLQGITKNVQDQIDELNLDNIIDGTTNKYITNDMYNGSISVASNFNVGKYFSTLNPNGNLHVYGDITIEGDINTFSPLITEYHRHISNYTIGFIDIDNVDDTSNKPSIQIDHNVGYSNIIEISCKGDEGIFTLSSNGNFGINRKDPTESLDVDGNIIFTGTINGVTATEVSYLAGMDNNIKTTIDTHDTNHSNYVLSKFNSIDINSIELSQDNSNYIKVTSNFLYNYSYGLSQDSSNYIKHVGSSLENLDSSNYIKNVSNFFIDKIENLTTDDIEESVSNKYIVDNVYQNDLTITGDLIVNGNNTELDSSLFASNYIRIFNETLNPALVIKQEHAQYDIFNVGNATDDNLFKIQGNGNVSMLGNVGIGTNNPSKKLDVDGDIKFAGKLFQGDEEFVSSFWLRSADNTSVSITSNVDIDGDLSAANATISGDLSAANATISGDLSVTNNVTIDGNLQVEGTTTTLNTDVYTTEKLDVQNSSAGVALNIIQNHESDIANFSNGASGTFTIANDGKVGINNTLPSTILHINGTDGLVIPVGTEDQRPPTLVTGTIRYNTDTSQFEGYGGTAWGSLGGIKDIDGDTYIKAQGIESNPLQDTDKLEFITNNNVNMIIDSNGNVGIGSTITAPTSTLHVGGDIKFTGTLFHGDEEFQSSYWEKATNNELYYTAANVGIGTNNPSQKLHVNGGNIITSGSMGVGVTTPAQKLHVNGQIIATNKITSFYSDERLKTDFEPIEDPLNIIELLNGFYYKPNELAKSLGIESNKRELGLSAQEVNKVLPELIDLAPLDITRDENDNIISKSGENYLTLSYDKMIPVVIEAIKKLNKEIKLLKEENKLLKENINS